jgi:succinyl-CoA synthetase beta subunit
LKGKASYRQGKQREKREKERKEEREKQKEGVVYVVVSLLLMGPIGCAGDGDVRHP